MTAPRAAERGFTLVEVMVSLLIFGMIAAAGVAILSFSVRAQTATDARFDDVAALNRTLTLLAGDLAQATIRASRDEGGTLVPAFTGEADGAMRFVRAGWSNVDAAPRASIQKVAYRFANGAFERVAYPMVDGAAPLPPAAILTGVRGVTARYRFRGAWSDRWDGLQGAALPQEVELSIVRSNGIAYRAALLVGAGYAPPQSPSPQSPPQSPSSPNPSAAPAAAFNAP